MRASLRCTMCGRFLRSNGSRSRRIDSRGVPPRLTLRAEWLQFTNNESRRFYVTSCRGNRDCGTTVAGRHGTHRRSRRRPQALGRVVAGPAAIREFPSERTRCAAALVAALAERMSSSSNRDVSAAVSGRTVPYCGTALAPPEDNPSGPAALDDPTRAPRLGTLTTIAKPGMNANSLGYEDLSAVRPAAAAPRRPARDLVQPSFGTPRDGSNAEAATTFVRAAACRKRRAGQRGRVAR